MNLPLGIGYPPMEADSALKMPEGVGWQYEPKWDGFRALCFRDGDEVELRSKAGQPLTRYFPEMVETLRALKAKQFVLDGELVVAADGKPAFGQLLQRIHPAPSRIQRLARETPSQLIAFDLLVDEAGASLVDKPLVQRRRELEKFARKFFAGPVSLSPATADIAEAKRWFQQMAGGLDGIVAKRLDLPYGSGERHAMVRIKNLRTADCAVGGFRYGQGKDVVGSLLLGLFDDGGLLHRVGFMSAIPAKDKPELTKKLEQLIGPPGFTGNAPGGPSRWSTERSTEWQPLKTSLVVEVQYDHFTGGRFRHGTKLLRWRPDKAPEQCMMSQVGKDSRSPLDLLAV